jgi:hypothetical protein
MPDRQPQTIPISGSQQLALSVASSIPDWSNRMDDIPRGQSASGGDHRFAGLTAALPRADRPALFHDSGSACPVDGAVNTAAAEQRTVGRIDDRVDIYPGYISPEELNAGVHIR